MAQYYHLNIYKTALDLLITATDLISKFNRSYRYTLGEKLQNASVDFIIMIYRANSTNEPVNRIIQIEKLIEQLQKINIYIRLSCEMNTITREKYIELTKYTQDMEKQLSGWLKYANNEIRTKEKAV